VDLSNKDVVGRCLYLPVFVAFYFIKKREKEKPIQGGSLYVWNCWIYRYAKCCAAPAGRLEKAGIPGL
jgi:hypothetical protein